MTSETSDAVVKLFAELIAHLERDPDYESDAFLDQHREHAAELRRRLERLRALGLMPAAGETRSPFQAAASRFGFRPGAFSEPREPGSRSSGLPALVELGRVIAGRYRIDGSIGKGGMGEVLEAWDLELHRHVALKLTRPSVVDAADREALSARVARFVGEAKLTGQLDHPNIVPVHDFGLTDEGEVWFAMRLVRGETLSAIAARVATGRDTAEREWPLTRCLQVILRVCDALAYAHSRGVIHRDLKPGNVMVGPYGEVQVMDWGLARVLGQQPETHAATPTDSPPFTGRNSASVDGDVFGTPSYMAPEQAAGQRAAIDERTDVFGVGALLHHLLLGHPPYTGRTREEVLANASAGLLDQPRLESFRRAGLPNELRAVCLRALQVRPADRYATVTALAEDIEAFLADRPGTAWSDGWTTRLAKLIRRRPTAGVATVAALLLGLVLLVAWNFAKARKAEYRERQIAAVNLVLTRGAWRSLEAKTMDLWLQSNRTAGIVRWSRELPERIAALWDTPGLLDQMRFDVSVPPERLAAELRAMSAFERQESPDGRTSIELRDNLYCLARHLYYNGIDSAWRNARGADIPAPIGEPNVWTQIARYAPNVLEFWAWLLELVPLLDDDSSVREVWSGQLAWWNGERVPMDELREAEDAMTPRALVFWAMLQYDVEGQGRRGAAAARLAIPLLERAVERDPRLTWAKWRLSRLYGEVPEAGEGTERTIELRRLAFDACRDSAFLTGELGNALLHAGREAEGKPFLRRAVGMDPSVAAYYFAPLSSIDREFALGLLRAALTLNPLHPDLLEIQARQEQALGNRSAAVEAWTALLYAEPWDVVSHNWRGRCLMEMAFEELAGDPASARDRFRLAADDFRVVVSETESVYPRQLLGVVLVRTGSYEEGLEELERSLAARRADLSSDAPRSSPENHRSRLREIRDQAPRRIFDAPEVSEELRERADAYYADLQAFLTEPESR